jgi:predicted O-methyltransferase YrrM
MVHIKHLRQILDGNWERLLIVRTGGVVLAADVILQGWTANEKDSKDHDAEV